RAADRRCDELLARLGRPGAPARRQISRQLRAELSEQLDHDDLHVGDSARLLCAAAARSGAQLALASEAAEGFAVQDVENKQLSEDVGKALPEAVDHELCRQ